MSKREQEKTAEATQRVTEEAKNAAQAQIGQQQAVAQEFQSTINRLFNYWYSPRVPAEIWARAVNNIAENVSAATKINNDIFFGNINAFGNAFERVQRQTEELSRINVNNAKTIANTARETVSEFSVNRQSL